MDVSRILTDLEESTGVAMIQLEVSENGSQNRITVCPGANYTITVEELEWLRGEIGSFDMLIVQFELPMPVVEAVCAWAHEAEIGRIAYGNSASLGSTGTRALSARAP